MTFSVVKTPSDEALEGLLKQTHESLPGGDAFAALRAAAAAHFYDQGLPNRRVEEWKYSDLKRAMPTDLALAGPVEEALIAERLNATRILADVARVRLVLVNGMYRADLSDGAKLPEGVSLRSVAEALCAGEFALDDPEIAKGDMALSLNTALLQDGVILEIADGVKVETPIEICNMMLGGGLATIRNRVSVGKGASVSVIETFIGDVVDGGLASHYQLNSAIDYRIADEAAVDVLRILRDGLEAVHVGTSTVVLGANVKFEHFTMATGGRFVRSQAFVRFEGEYTDGEFFGATILDGEQHNDITLTVDHAVPNCNSKEQYRTVLDDKAEGVFQGQIVVRQYAQKTDAKMMSQALILSEDAAFFNKPELEIFADDVVCGHGATCGELDEDLLFYLRSRGIPEVMAKKMLVLAFLAEAVENITNEQFVEALEAFIAERLGIEY